MSALGYACINMELSDRPKKQRVTTNRSMIKATFSKKGIVYASELALQNCKDLKKILKWNYDNNIHFFRMSSDIFPWASEYEICDLPDYEEISKALSDAGEFARAVDQRLTTHPGPFNKLTSPRDHVVKNTIRDLEIHGELMDLLGMPRTPWAKINIHVGASYNDKPLAIGNFCRNFSKLSESVRTRLTVENDDRGSLYSTAELVKEMACSTWKGVVPVVHYSESRAEEYSDPKIRPQAHSDRIVNKIETYGHDVYVMIEAKHKEQALLEYRNKFQTNKLLLAS